VIKRDELANPNSCLNRAKDDEYVFVLKGTDITTPGLGQAEDSSREEQTG
jgi:hypothetical protein